MEAWTFGHAPRSGRQELVIQLSLLKVCVVDCASLPSLKVLACANSTPGVASLLLALESSHV